MIKLIAFDIDGTLNNSNHEISIKTKEVIMEAQRKGIIVVMASGRPESGLVDSARALDLKNNRGVLISYNGSKAIDLESGCEIYNEFLDIHDAKAVLEHMKKFNVKPMIYDGEYIVVNNVYDNYVNYNGGFNVIEFEARQGHYLLKEARDMTQYVDFPINKILTAGDPEYLEAHYKEMMEPFKDRLNCTFTARFYFEFMRKDINKGKALAKIAEFFGFERDEIAAFGDASNDIEMLEYAGHGIAMGNAFDSVKEVADYVTLSNDEDGIVHAFKNYLHII